MGFRILISFLLPVPVYTYCICKNHVKLYKKENRFEVYRIIIYEEISFEIKYMIV